MEEHSVPEPPAGGPKRMRRLVRAARAVERRADGLLRAAERKADAAKPSTRPAAKAGLVFTLILLVFLAPLAASLLATTILLLGWASALTDLLKALRPVLLPTVLVLIVGGFRLETGQQVVVGVLLALFLIPWAARDWARSGRVIETVGEVLMSLLPRLLIVFVAGFVFLIAAALIPGLTTPVGDAIDAFDGVGGVAIAFAIVATFGLLAALMARLLGYCQTPGRIGVTVLVVLGLVRLLFEQKLLGEPDDFDYLSAGGWFTAAAAVLVVVVTAEILTELPKSAGLATRVRGVAAFVSTPPGRGGHKELWDIGLALALAATVALGAALVWSAIEVHSAPTNVTGVRPGKLKKPVAEMELQELADTFMPVLVFSEDQRWLPQRVDRYVELAELEPAPPAGVKLDRKLPTACPDGRRAPCFGLECPSADDPCALTNDGLAQRSGDGELHRDGVVYVRVAPVSDPAPPFGRRVKRILQFWLFYPYDEWRAPVAGGQLVQRHAGDWEAVTIGLGEEEPLFLALSQHCGGQWFHWSSARVDPDLTPQTHPRVGVAVGSHANYQLAEAARPPDWSTCQGIPGDAVELLTYTWNIRDRTANDWELLPGQWEKADEDTWPMTFPGTWGTEDVTEFKGLATRELAHGNGPPTPTGQPLWTRPMHRIFCEDGWRGPRRRQAC